MAESSALQGEAHGPQEAGTSVRWLQEMNLA